MATATNTVTIPPLPNWKDAASVTSYLTTILGGVFTVVTLLTKQGEPSIVQALLPSVGALVAAGAQIVNVVTHRSVQKAAIAAAK